MSFQAAVDALGASVAGAAEAAGGAVAAGEDPPQPTAAAAARSPQVAATHLLDEILMALFLPSLVLRSALSKTAGRRRQADVGPLSPIF